MPDSTSSEALPPSTAPARLLVVDDEFAGRTALSRRLIKRGYAVDTADGGEAALEKILQEHYDLVLLDQRMPGMSGVELLRLLRVTHSQTDLPVIMVTGVDESASIVEALEQGANDYVVKPVEMPEISARIHAQLTRSRALRADARTADSLRALADGLRHAEDGRNTPKPTPFSPAEAVWEWEWGPEQGQARFSAPWRALLGLEDEEIGESLSQWLDRVHPQDLLRVRRELKAHLDHENLEFRSEHRLRCRDGHYRWVLCRGVAEQNENGELQRISGDFTDIENRKAIDALTGLGNRMQWLDRLASTLELAQASLTPDVHATTKCWLVARVDLDRFKAINETLGYEVADQLLIEVGVRLRHELGPASTVARIASDEFAILSPGVQGSASEVAAFGELLMNCFTAPLPVGWETVTIGASAGIAVAQAGDTTPDEIMHDSDIALREARTQGGRRWCAFETKMREREKIRTTVARDLRYAVERNQLEVFYQPKLDLKTRRISGFEALLRWRHPELGLLPPIEFIPLAEETGFIVPAGEWILREACVQLKAWQRQCPMEPPLMMSVNLSVRQLRDPHLVSAVRETLEATGIPPESLKLELTESSLIEEREPARAVLTEIQSMGVGLMLDDFGTGYASLSYLSVVKFDALKIDRSFVMRMDTDAESRAIIKTILGLGRELRMMVIAEGIETEPQLGLLIDLGCEAGQGYLFSKPVAPTSAGQLLRDDFRSRQTAKLSRNETDAARLFVA
ncbi:MAG: EAL domain-containing protein [Acidobacteriota bacterium]